MLCSVIEWQRMVGKQEQLVVAVCTMNRYVLSPVVFEPDGVESGGGGKGAMVWVRAWKVGDGID